jgi:aminoglycoside 2''-phosphotransferase
VLRERLVGHIRADFPSLAIDSARLVTSGWDHDVIILNEDLVFRFPRDDDVDLGREIAVLNALRGKTMLAIPRIEYVGTSARYVGYRMLRGQPLTSDRYARRSDVEKAKVADDLARFLFEIHSAISVARARSFGLKLDDHESYVREAAGLRARVGDPALVLFIDDTIQEASSRLRLPAPQAFLYNDLHGDNMAFDEIDGRLNGIFDFGDVAYGDINRDFATLYYIDRTLMEATAAAYERTSGLMLSRRRMILWYRLERFADLAELVNLPGSQETERIVREINRCMAEPALYSDNP